MKKLAFALLAIAATPAVALANEPEGDKKAAGLFLVCMTVVPLFLYPLGLAFHLLLRATAPVRTRQLVHVLETRYGRTLGLGVANVALLFLIMIATAQAAPVVAMLAYFIYLGLAAVGSHGIARVLGARILGSSDGTRAELKELAVGWFVVAYIACFPILGWIVGTFWAARGIGGVLSTLFVPENEAEPTVVVRPREG